MFEFKPTDDGTFLNLKQIARSGGEKGPLYDAGVLSVIDQIEKTGTFVKNPMRGIILLYSTHQKLPQRLLSDDEINQAKQFLAERGWTLAQAMQFAGGIDTAESLLSHLGPKKETD